jgi:tRNA A-37 threonylcarbamoyl transferase component Bud32
LINQLSAFGITSNTFTLDGSRVHLKEVVRVLPAKRLVCRALWRGQQTYIKLFFGASAKKYALRDEVGVSCLKAAEILTPPLFYSGSVDNMSALALVFEAIPQAENAEFIYQRISLAERETLLLGLMKVLAQHHQANIIQTDLYLKNFLVAGDDIYTLDGDGVREYRVLSRKRALQNLAVLISKFDALEVERWLPKMLEVYATARNWSSAPDLVSFKRLVNQHRTFVASHYADKKVFRQCTDVNICRQSRLFEAVSSSYAFTRLPIAIDDCDRMIQKGISFKQGNTCTVSLAGIDGIKTVIKRYNIKSFWHGINRACRQTRAAGSWANAHRLNILGIATPKPIALIEERFGYFRGKAYFLSEYLDAPDASTFFAQIKNKKSQAEAIQNIVEMFYRMYLLRLSHGDMKASNIKMLGENPYLIDLDSMQQHAWDFLAKKRHVKDLKRFMRNWQDQPTLYNTFIKAFFAVYADSQVLRLAGLSVD